MKIPFLVTASVVLTIAAHAQDAKPLRAAQLPVRADAPVLFAPRGWQIEKRISGDLNRDNVPDAALVLVENQPAQKPDPDSGPAPRQRALVVLLREGKGWHRVGFNGELLLGTRDGGAFFGVVPTPVDVFIRKGVLIVSMESGSRDVLDTTHRFRYNAKRQGMDFIGFDSTDRDRLTGDVTIVSTNFLTGIKRTTTLKGEGGSSRTVTTRVSRAPRTLESLRADER